MAQPGVTLGDFVFKTRNGAGGLTCDQPENVKFGLKEKINVHKMIGGARILDMMGDDPEDISWSGFFLGPDAADRAQTLYNLEQEKELVDLTFGLFKATVVVSQLDLTYKKAFWIEYSIICIVVDQAVAGGGVDGGIIGGAVDPAAGDPAINAANANLGAVNTPNDAGNALGQGIGGLGQGVAAPGNPVAFA